MPSSAASLALVGFGSLLIVTGATGSHQGTKQPLSRFPFPAEDYARPSGVFNPAAVFREHHGWVVMLRQDRCFYQECGIHHTNTSAIVSYFASEAKVDAASIAAAAHPWPYDERGMQQLLQETNSTLASMADWRPFARGHQVWAGHWIKFGWEGNRPNGHACWGNGWGDPHSCEYSMLSRLDPVSRTLHPVHVFRHPLVPLPKPRAEKNWAFFEHQGQLLFFYSMLPCSLIHQFEPASPKGAELVHAYCYAGAESVVKSTGLDMQHARMSGNPVWWRQSNGTEVLLGMVHARAARSLQAEQSYLNWLLQIDPSTLQIVAISAQPVVASDTYALDGYFKGVLIVGSFHVVQEADGQQMLRLFLGEGDQYAGWEHVPMASIHWHRLPPGSVVELPSVAAAQRWLKRGSNQLIRAATLS